MSLRQGLRVARVAGVPVIVTPSWLLFGLYVVLVYQPQVQDRVGSTQAYVVASLLAVMLLVSVILHEVGHCIVARALGLPVTSVTVTFLAGRTHVAKPARTPADEYAVAIVGPMVSLLLTATGVAAAAQFDEGSLTREVFVNLALSNGVITALNLVPGLPLDGGRVLRSLIWQLGGDPYQSVRIAARAGMVIATLVVPVVLLVVLPAAGIGTVDLTLLLLAFVTGLFLFTGAYASLQQAQVAARLPALSVAALARPALEVPPATPLAEAVRRAHERELRAIVVVDSRGRPEGVVSEAWVRTVPAARRPWVTTGEGARKVEPGMVLDPGLTGEALLAAMTATPASEYLVPGPVPRVLVSTDVAAAMSAGDV